MREQLTFEKFKSIDKSLRETLGIKLKRKEIGLTNIAYERKGEFDPYGDLINEIIPDGLPSVLVFSEEASERKKVESFERLRFRHEKILDGESKGFTIVVGDIDWLGIVFMNSKRELSVQLQNSEVIKLDPKKQRLGLYVYTGEEVQNRSRAFWAKTFIIAVEATEEMDNKAIEPDDSRIKLSRETETGNNEQALMRGSSFTEKTEVDLNSKEALNAKRTWNENQFGFFDELKRELVTDSEGNKLVNPEREIDFGLGIKGVARVAVTSETTSIILLIKNADIGEFVRSEGERLKPIREDSPFLDDQLMIKWVDQGYRGYGDFWVEVQRLFRTDGGGRSSRKIEGVSRENLARLTGAMKVTELVGPKLNNETVVYQSGREKDPNMKVARPKNPYKDRPGGRKKKGGNNKGRHGGYHR